MTDTLTEYVPATEQACQHAADMVAAAAFVAGLDLPDGLEFMFYPERLMACANADEMSWAARAMAPCEKGGDDDYLRLIRRFGSYQVEVFSARDAVCERIQVGTRTVEKPVVVGTEEVEEPVYEWRCSPLLAEAGAL